VLLFSSLLLLLILLQALENNDYRFALLLAQAGSNPQFSDDITAQLRLWHELGAEQYIEKERLAIFRLLSSDVNTVLEYVKTNSTFKKKFKTHSTITNLVKEVH
jgi:hypothetical protein